MRLGIFELMTSLHPYWPAPQGQNINATVALPGSKSLTNRELLLSAIASEPTLLIAPLVSRDSSLMISALESLGIDFEWQGDDLLVTPQPLLGPATIDCGLAGTVMRFVPPLSMLATGEIPGLHQKEDRDLIPLQQKAVYMKEAGVKGEDPSA